MKKTFEIIATLKNGETSIRTFEATQEQADAELYRVCRSCSDVESAKLWEVG